MRTSPVELPERFDIILSICLIAIQLAFIQYLLEDLKITLTLALLSPVVYFMFRLSSLLILTLRRL